MNKHLVRYLMSVIFGLSSSFVYGFGGMNGNTVPDSWTWNMPGSGRIGGGGPQVDWDNIGGFSDKPKRDTRDWDRQDDREWRRRGTGRDSDRNN